MLNLGIIGTNWITNQFIDAAIETKEYQLVAVYSRKKEQAETFGKPYGATIFETKLEDFANHPGIDVVYIASPNSLHFQQALTLMKAKKHVIVEKPMFSNPTEWHAAKQVAEENDVFLLEAARHIHEQNFAIVKEKLTKIDDIKGATFTYMKYSSRYDQVLEGQEPNIFSPHFSGGALSDLGVYGVYAAIGWFGMPISCHYFAQKIATEVDGMGTMILRYPGFDVTLLTGKMVDSYLPSEIYTLNQTILMDGVNAISSIEVIDRKTATRQELATPPQENPMVDEAKAFAKVLNHPEDKKNQELYQSWLLLSQQVNEVLKKLRDDAGIVFDADKI